MTAAQDALFRTLADPTRRALFERLCREGEQTVGALTEGSGVSQPAVSKHLKVLREAELVSMAAAGQRRIYSIDTAALEDLVHWCTELVPAPAVDQEPATAETGTEGQLAVASNPTAQQIGR